MRYLPHSLCLAALLAGPASLSRAAGPTKLVVMAATAYNDHKPEVRLRWTVTDGWLPERGFHLYRIQGNNRTLLNPTRPFAVNLNGFSAQGRNLLNLAKSQIAAGEHFAPGIQRQSSLAAFRAMRETMEAVRQQLGPALSAEAVAQQVRQIPPVAQYLALTRRTPNAKPAARAPLSQDDQVRQVRSQLLVGAMLNSGAAHNLGLAFEDTDVHDGETYEYALRTLNDQGQENPNDEATTTITVGKDPQPQPPTVDKPLQHDTDPSGTCSVDLHWEPPTPKEAASYGVAGYRVLRVDSQHPNGVPAHDGLVLVSYVNNVATLTTFRDTHVPQGPVTYKVSLVDSFQRESAPTTTDPITLKDLRTPQAVRAACAWLSEGSATPVSWRVQKGKLPLHSTARTADNIAVVWRASSQPGVVYNVYRIEDQGEQAPAKVPTVQMQRYPGAQPVLLTPGTTAGAPVDLHTITGRQVFRLLPNAPTVIQGTAPGKLGTHVSSIPSLKGIHLDTDDLDADSALKQLDAATNSHYRTDVKLLCFVDAKPPKDHYYRYLVTADYAANKLDSVACHTTAVAMPLLTPPASPTGLAAGPFISTVTEEIKKQIGGRYVDIPALAARQTRDDHGVWQPLIDPKGFTHVVAPDEAGAVSLNWNPVQATTNMTYRVYRANATGYFPAEEPAKNAASPAGTAHGRSKPDIVIAPGKTLRFSRQNARPPQSSWVLLGQVSDPTFTDPVQRSHAHYYLYHVVAVNRWGVASGPSADLSVRVPATLPPSVPTLLQVSPNEAGQVVVTIRANPVEEEVEQYQVWRKELATNKTLSYAPPAVQMATAGAHLPLPPADQPHANVTFQGRSLVAGGTEALRVGNGAARFGVFRHNSPAAALAQTLGQNARQKVAGNITAQLSPDELKALLDWSGYTQVGLATVNGDQAVYQDSNVQPGTDYAYRVVVLTRDNVKSDSSIIMDASPYKVKADPPTNGKAIYANGGVTVSWTAPQSGATGFIVKRAVVLPNNRAPAFIQVQVIPGATPTSYTDYNARSRKSYTYAIQAIDSSGNVSDPLQIQYTGKP